MTEELLKLSVLKNTQKKAFFSYKTLFRKGQIHLDLLCRTISAMANTLGGEIFIGLKIEKFKLIEWENREPDFPSKEVFMALINEQIQPTINHLKIDEINSGFHISVPNSLQKPHISPNYKYYKRILSKNQVMEEFEIRQLYQMSAKSELKLLTLTKLQGVPIMSSGLFEEMRFYPRIHIQNLGQRIEKDYKLEIAIPSNLIDETFTVLHKYLKGYELDKNIYTIPSTEPLFQAETKSILELSLKLNSINYSTFLNSEINLKLYSTEGLHEQTYKLSEWLHYKGQLPLKESFVKKIEE